MKGAESSLQICEMSNVCRRRPVCVQQGPQSVANHMLGLGEFYLREKQEPEFETKLDRLCFSYSVSQPAVTLSSTER